MVVVFPEPFGPRKPKTAPFGTARSTPSTAICWPNRLVRPVVSMLSSPPPARRRSRGRHRMVREQPSATGYRAGHHFCAAAAWSRSSGTEPATTRPSSSTNTFTSAVDKSRPPWTGTVACSSRAAGVRRRAGRSRRELNNRVPAGAGDGRLAGAVLGRRRRRVPGVVSVLVLLYRNLLDRGTRRRGECEDRRVGGPEGQARVGDAEGGIRLSARLDLDAQRQTGLAVNGYCDGPDQRRIGLWVSTRL